jgi:hypothetical protein
MSLQNYRRATRLTRHTKEGIQRDTHVLDDEAVCPIVDLRQVSVSQYKEQTQKLV